LKQLKYAASKDVFIGHAAGDSKDDVEPNSLQTNGVEYADNSNNRTLANEYGPK
jgi:hypothetical protein